MRDWTNTTSTPVGILRPEEFGAHAQIEIVAPDPALARWVANYWCLRWDLPADATYLSAVLPHPSCNLTLELGSPRPGVGDDRVVVTGVTTHRFEVPVSGSGWVLGVKFRPGGLHALSGANARTLTDRVVPAATVVPRSTCEAIRGIAAGTPAGDACRAADQALLPIAPDAPDDGYDTVTRLIDDMLGDPTVLRVAQLEQRHGIGRRQIERLFARYVGVGPKWVLARSRLHHVVTALDQGYEGSLTDLAHHHGWYDQAHFIRDFADQVGVTPGEYRSRR